MIEQALSIIPRIEKKVDYSYRDFDYLRSSKKSITVNILEQVKHCFEEKREPSIRKNYASISNGIFILSSFISGVMALFLVRILYFEKDYSFLISSNYILLISILFLLLISFYSRQIHKALSASDIMIHERPSRNVPIWIGAGQVEFAAGQTGVKVETDHASAYFPWEAFEKAEHRKIPNEGQQKEFIVLTLMPNVQKRDQRNSDVFEELYIPTRHFTVPNGATWEEFYNYCKKNIFVKGTD